MDFTTIGNAKKQARLSYLGSVNKSAKLVKNGKVSGQYTYGIYLAPASESGYNVCSHSTAECRQGCLATSGRAGMELLAGKTKTSDCRSNKTKLFYEQPQFFMQWLIAELSAAQAKAKADDFGISARLNCTSDIDWGKVLVNGQTIFEIFPDVQFYDYTKNPLKFKNIAPNYHLTFSYTGYNGAVAKQILEQGHNIAVVFNTKRNRPLPKMFAGFKVVDGDLTDYRPNDGKGVVVGLRFKRIADQTVQAQVMKSAFVVDENSLNEQGMRNVRKEVMA